MKHALHLAIISICVVNLAAQTPSATFDEKRANWENVKSLARGTTVLVGPNVAPDIKGKVESITDDSVVLKLKTGQRTFARTDIVWISRRVSHRRKHILTGAGWGAGIGGGFAALMSYAYGCCGKEIALGVAETAGIGALIGAAMPAGEWRQVYHRRIGPNISQVP